MLRRPLFRFTLVMLALATGCSWAPSGGPRVGGGAGEKGSSEAPELRVAVLTDAEAVRLTGEGLDRTITTDSPPLREPLVAGGRDGFTSVNGITYRGDAEVRRVPGGRLTVINRVPLEDYVRGVVPNEISCGSAELLEAIKAQAIAARTYALANLGHYADSGYDLMNTVTDQVYTGLAAEKPLGDRAVAETAGIVATWQGEPIQMNYSSTCGGHTASRDEVWDKPALPYLRGVGDDGGDGSWCRSSKYYEWHEVWTVAEFMTGVRANSERELGAEIPEDARLKDVKVADRSESGRVAALDIVTDQGTFTARKDRIRWAVRRPAGEALRSTLFDVAVEKSHGRVTRVTFDGHGWGHGVGLCQVGAMERARHGANCADILDHYYQGIHLTRMFQ